MVCPKCNHEPAPNDKFCEECGAQLATPTTVQSCNGGGEACQPDEEGFCSNCGKQVLITRTTRSKAKIKRAHDEIAIDTGLAMISDIGLRHKVNEDAGAIGRRPDGQAVMVIADGVSSSWSSEIASQMVTNQVRDSLLALPLEVTPEEYMLQSVLQAHAAILSMPHQAPDAYSGPETTLVAALEYGDAWIIAWVGDSRAYWIEKNRQVQLTRDDSWVEDIVDAKKMSREEALKSKMAHAITQALGMRDETPEVHVIRCEKREGNMLLLCTDGLWNYFESDADLALASRYGEIDATALSLCQTLVAAANGQGGKDNISVAICLPGTHVCTPSHAIL